MIATLLTTLAVTWTVDTAFAQSAGQPVVAVAGKAEIDPNDASSFLLPLESALNVANAVPAMDTEAGTRNDMDFLEDRVGKYLNNGKSLQTRDGQAPPATVTTLSIPAERMIGGTIPYKSIVSSDSDVALAVFDRTGALQYAVLENDRDVTRGSARLKVSQGPIIDCVPNEAGCDVETLFLIGSEHFSLKAGQAYAPRDPAIVAVTVLRSQREQRPTADPWQLLEYAVVFSADSVPQDAEGPFEDVSFTHRYAEAIRFVKERGIVTGYPDGTFRPERALNRAEFVKMIVEASAEDAFRETCETYPGELRPFSDVLLSTWYGPYVCTAKYRDWIGGYPDGSFGPDRTIIFAEAAKIAIGAHGLTVRPAAEYEEWYVPYVEALASADAIPPTVTTADQTITRGEFARMLFSLEANAARG